MSWLSFVLLGLALAMDCFAVSLCMGLSKRRLTIARAVAAPLIFGLFQGVMPLLGWGLGLAVRPLIENFDHWVAFLLLLAVAGHMFKEAWDQFRAEACAAPPCPNTPELRPLRFTRAALRPLLTLLTLAVATSLDALAVGLGMAFANVSLWWPALIIGGTTFIVSLAGICLGHGMGKFINGAHYAVALGGCVLIGIGFKILVEHGVF